MSVYLIRSGEDGPVKIGFALNPQKRLRELQIGNSARLELIATFDGGVREERALHERFNDLRITGEWFDFDSRMLDGIERFPVDFKEGLRETQAEYVISRFGGLSALSDAVGRRITVVQGWKERGTIPLKHYERILDAGRTLDPPFERHELLETADGELHGGLSQPAEDAPA